MQTYASQYSTISSKKEFSDKETNSNLEVLKKVIQKMNSELEKICKNEEN